MARLSSLGVFHRSRLTPIILIVGYPKGKSHFWVLPFLHFSKIHDMNFEY
jgi:hypothetical protein